MILANRARIVSGAAIALAVAMLCNASSMLGAPLTSPNPGAQQQNGAHEAWAAYHLTSLPLEIRANVMRYQATCGAPLAATHLFAIPRGQAGVKFLALHFENLWCPNAKVVCQGDACLHEVYASTGGGPYRRVFRHYVNDIALEASPRGVELILTDADVFAGRLRWNGQRFVAIEQPFSASRKLGR